VLAPPIIASFRPGPVVSIYVDAELRAVVIFILHMPAVTFVIETMAAEALVAVNAKTPRKAALTRYFFIGSPFNYSSWGQNAPPAFWFARSSRTFHSSAVKTSYGP
jgi:hypothetical protein